MKLDGYSGITNGNYSGQREAGITPEEAVAHAANVVENIQKLARPLWALLVVLACGAFWFGSFWVQYQDSINNGSPFMRSYIQKQQELDYKRDAAIDRLNDHLDRLEQSRK